MTKLIRFKKASSIKAEILNLQATLSQSRIALKGKIKKKSNVFRSSFKSPISEGDMFDNALKQLAENSFESSDDFQNYFDLSRKIVNFIQVENKGDVDKNSNIENNFMCSDFKTEMDIIRLIKVMTNMSSKINSRIEDNNKTAGSKPIQKVDALVFNSLMEINRIFKSDTHAETFGSRTPGDSDDKAS